MKTGRFIVFEGGEGSGKSSHLQLTAEFLRSRGQTVVTTHEPGGTACGQHIRKLILESQISSAQPLSTKTELLLFLADRAQHVAELIQPALDRGEIVLCDRFTGSTLAYQIGGRKLNQVELIAQLEAFARDQLQPELVIYLDIDPALGIQRKRSQTDHVMNSFDEFDLEFHRDVRAYFQSLAETTAQWKTLDANRPVTAVQFDINQLVSPA
jgi:dTMP kinase